MCNIQPEIDEEGCIRDDEQRHSCFWRNLGFLDSHNACNESLDHSSCILQKFTNRHDMNGHYLNDRRRAYA